MSLGTELAAAVASATSDASYLRAIVQGPAAGAASLVALPNGALIKTLARIAQEVTGGFLPLAGGTLTGFVTQSGGAGDAMFSVMNNQNPLGMQFKVGSGGAGAYLWYRDNGFLSFGVNNGEIARLVPGIGLGIAKTPQVELDVAGRVAIHADLQSLLYLAIADDPRMYDPIPAEEETPPPIGAPIDPLDIHVTANTSILNLRSKANASGWTGNPAQAVTITIDPGVHVVWAARGTWPAGFQPTLINQGTISGADGAPGVGGEGGQGITFGLAAFSGGTGGTGGTALDASSGPLKVDNSAGTIRGGRGGGGGGGGGGGAYHETLETSGDAPIIVGHPMDGGAGGAGNGGVGAAGMTDGIATGGTGGTGGALGAYASAGSNGGAGSPGSGGTTNYDGAVGGAGGPGGAAVTGNANITWVGGTGTRVGAIL